MRVALFPTCVVDAVAPGIGVATVRVLRRTGHDVMVPERATCCGQPAWNAGHADEAANVARTTLHALRSTAVDAVVIPAGSCTTMVRVFWSELFELVGTVADTEAVADIASRTYELTEFLTNHGPPETTDPDTRATFYHRSCHMLRELRVTDEPEVLLAGTGANLVLEPPDRCCGFGGMFAVKLPEVSTSMADDVLDTASARGIDRIVGCDASCLLHLRARADRRELGIEFRHLATVLEATSRVEPS